MKRLLLQVIILLPQLLVAQSEFQFEAATGSGYEYNVFNAGEGRVFTPEEGETISAIQSGLFQQLDLRADWEKQMEKHQLNLGAKTRIVYFPTLTGADLLRPDLRLEYAYQISKKSSVAVNSKYMINRTNRIPDETTVLSLPQSYQRGQSDLTFKFQPFRYNKSRVRATVFRKQYQESEDRNLRYNAVQLNLESKQRFKRKGLPSSYLTMGFDFTKRNYTDDRFIVLEEDDEYFEEDDEDYDFEEDWDFEEEEFEINTNYRVWTYHTVKLEYSFAPAKNFRLKPGIQFQQRTDVLDEMFGYRQLRPYIGMTLEENRLTIDLKAEGILRNFSQLKASKGNDELLQHRYLLLDLEFDYQLSDQWAFIVRGIYRQRWRNQAESATSFLPYTNAMLSLGFKYQFSSP